MDFKIKLKPTMVKINGQITNIRKLPSKSVSDMDSIKEILNQDKHLDSSFDEIRILSDKGLLEAIMFLQTQLVARWAASPNDFGRTYNTALAYNVSSLLTRFESIFTDNGVSPLYKRQIDFEKHIKQFESDFRITLTDGTLITSVNDLKDKLKANQSLDRANSNGFTVFAFYSNNDQFKKQTLHMCENATYSHQEKLAPLLVEFFNRFA